ncbi:MULTISPECIES: hypothetical protein [Terrabacteria group]|uniref:hypothetical protein n=1 Tax=Bacillati TaxID=1783272 RepID=UPI000C7E599B|nr:hypothetical protein [Planomicrobium sp. MB-3u-38]PKH10659.1 hypothetical protein CXF70_08590 [Planomicrobium sp. MB-3u-38]
MNKRGAGVIFIVISAILICSKYIAAAIFGSNVNTWDEEMFQYLLSYIGSTLNTLSICALLIGIAYICWAEYEGIKSKKSI